MEPARDFGEPPAGWREGNRRLQSPVCAIRPIFPRELPKTRCGRSWHAICWTRPRALRVAVNQTKTAASRFCPGSRARAHDDLLVHLDRPGSPHHDGAAFPHRRDPRVAGLRRVFRLHADPRSRHGPVRRRVAIGRRPPPPRSIQCVHRPWSPDGMRFEVATGRVRAARRHARTRLRGRSATFDELIL